MPHVLHQQKSRPAIITSGKIVQSLAAANASQTTLLLNACPLPDGQTYYEFSMAGDRFNESKGTPGRLDVEPLKIALQACSSHGLGWWWAPKTVRFWRLP